MVLQTIRTSDFRSLYDFALDLHPFTILIGRNDSGKSNVLHAAELLLNDRATSKASKYDWSAVDQKKKGTRYPREINIFGVLNGFNHLEICRKIKIWSHQPASSELLIKETSGWRPIIAEEASQIPALYYLHPRTGALQEAFNPSTEHNIFTLVKDWMPHDLSREYDLDKLMRTYASTPNAMSAYITFFENEVYGPLHLAFPQDFPLIRFDIKYRGEDDRNLLLVRELTHINEKQARFRLPIDHHGSALLSITAIVLSVAILQEYHKQHFESKPMIMAIEEPEVHLHADAQRIFLNYLRWLSNTHQIIVTTHSPILVDRAEPKNVVILRRTSLRDEKDAKKEGKNQIAGSTYAIQCDYQKNWQGVISALGVKLSDVLMMGEINLLVEGPTEAIIMPAIGRVLIKREQLTIDPDRIFISHGDGSNLPNLAAILRRTGNPTVVMLDNDRGGRNMKRELEKQPSPLEEIFMPDIKSLPLPLNQLTECEFEDLLDPKMLLKAFNKAFETMPGFDFLPINYNEFEAEQMRLFGRKESFGWIATVNSLVRQKRKSSDKKSECFSKPTLAETVATEIIEERMPIPEYCRDVYQKIEQKLRGSS